VVLEDHSTGKMWPDMSNVERVNSSRDTGDLHWTGGNAIAFSGVLSAGMSNGHIRIYAPNPAESGSSVSHWDEVLEPDELMEPYADPETIDDLTFGLFVDIGWSTRILFTGSFESGDTSDWSATVN
jgi:hypothetical protein